MLIKSRPITEKRFDRISLSILHNHLIELILLGIKNEINILIACDEVKLILNDNNGDLIIFNTKKYNFKELKRQIKEILN